MYPESARNVRSWYGPRTTTIDDMEFDYYRPRTGDFVCYRVATEIIYDGGVFSNDELKRRFLSLETREFVAYSASLFHEDIGTFSTLENLGDELHKWIFVERDIDMLQLRLLSMKTVAFHLHNKMDELRGGRFINWMLLTNAARTVDAPWRGGRHTAADWLMVIDDLLDRFQTEFLGNITSVHVLEYMYALEDFARFIKTLDDESDDEDDTPAKRRRTELVQKIGSILDENTGAMKENDYRVAMDALKELM
mgnify:CR=1 FL=1